MDNYELDYAKAVSVAEDSDDALRYTENLKQKMTINGDSTYKHVCWRHRSSMVGTYVEYPTQCPHYCTVGTASLRHLLNSYELSRLPADFFDGNVDIPESILYALSLKELDLLVHWGMSGQKSGAVVALLAGIGIDSNVKMSQRTCQLLTGALERVSLHVQCEEMSDSDGVIAGDLSPHCADGASDGTLLDNHVSYDDVPYSPSYVVLGQALMEKPAALNERKLWFDTSRQYQRRRCAEAFRFRPPHAFGIELDLWKYYIDKSPLDDTSRTLSMRCLSVGNPARDYYSSKDPFGIWSKIYMAYEVHAFDAIFKFCNKSPSVSRFFLGVLPSNVPLTPKSCSEIVTRDVPSGGSSQLSLRRMVYQIPGHRGSDLVGTVDGKFPPAEDVRVVFGVVSEDGDVSSVSRINLVLITKFTGVRPPDLIAPAIVFKKPTRASMIMSVPARVTSTVPTEIVDPMAIVKKEPLDARFDAQGVHYEISGVPSYSDSPIGAVKEIYKRRIMEKAFFSVSTTRAANCILDVMWNFSSAPIELADILKYSNSLVEQIEDALFFFFGILWDRVDIKKKAYWKLRFKDPHMTFYELEEYVGVAHFRH